MASPTQWTWVWVASGSWWWTGRPGVLWSMELQSVRHDWATELNWTINTTEIQRIRVYYGQLYVNKMDNLEEMVQWQCTMVQLYLREYNLVRLNQEEIKNMKRPITSTEIGSVIKKCPQSKSSEPDGFTVDFYHTFREELTPILQNYSKKLQRKKHFQTHSMKWQLPWYQNKDIIHKKGKITGQ